MIVEIATVTRKDGSTTQFGRERGRKLFVALDPVGAALGLGYSRRSLNERPQKDRNVATVMFGRPSQPGGREGGGR